MKKGINSNGTEGVFNNWGRPKEAQNHKREVDQKLKPNTTFIIWIIFGAC